MRQLDRSARTARVVQVSLLMQEAIPLLNKINRTVARLNTLTEQIVHLESETDDLFDWIGLEVKDDLEQAVAVVHGDKFPLEDPPGRRYGAALPARLSRAQGGAVRGVPNYGTEGPGARYLPRAPALRHCPRSGRAKPEAPVQLLALDSG